MGKEDFELKKLKGVIGDITEAMTEGREKIRILQLSGDEVVRVLDMSDSEIDDLIAERGFDYDENFIRIKTPRSESEGYMKSAAEIRNWLRSTNLN